MKKLFIFLCLLFPLIINAQTWNGSTSNDWNTAANWTPNAVPSAGSVVTIPAVVAPSFNPKLNGNVTVNSITLNAGSLLDVNDFSISCTNKFDVNATAVNPATINNSGTVNPIRIDIGSAGNASHSYWNGLVTGDDIEVVVRGIRNFYEGNSSGNIFNGNYSVKNLSSGFISIGHNSACNYYGNVNIVDSSNATFYAFTTLPSSVTGNFNLIKPNGGQFNMGKNGQTVLIGGKMDIDFNGNGTYNNFNLRGIKNTTNGGGISIKDVFSTNFENDTFLVNQVKIDSFNTTSSGYYISFYGNKISGDVSFSSKSGNSGTQYFHRNTINGNLTLLTNGGTLYDSYNYPNTISGNFDLTINSASNVSTSVVAGTSVGGNYTVNRNVLGTTSILSAATQISGNFSYTNLVGGETYLGTSNVLSNVTGKMDIDFNGNGTYNNFNLRGIKNTTNGGGISIKDVFSTNFENDTFLVNQVKIDSFNTTSSGYYISFYGNKISGDVSFSSKSGNSGTQHFHRNTINGNLTLLTNGGVLNESNSYPNTIGGNFDLIINSASNVSTSLVSGVSVGGNYTVNRTVWGRTWLLNRPTQISGNFSYTNLAGGDTYLGTSSYYSNIGGKVDIDYEGVGLPYKEVQVYGIKNNTGGGNIDIKNVGYQTRMIEDTLQVLNFKIDSFYSTSSGYIMDFHSNQIVGDVSFSSQTGNSGDQYFYKNTIDGDFSAINNGGAFYEAYNSSNEYKGNATFTNNSSSGFILNYNNIKSLYHKNLTLNGPGNINVNSAQFVGNTNSLFDDNRSATSTLDSIRIAKTSGASLSFGQPTTILKMLRFNGGDIISSASNILTLADGSTFQEVSDNSKVLGPLTVRFKNSTTTALDTLPIGKAGKFIPVILSGVSSSTTQEWTAELVDGDADDYGYPLTSLQNPPLERINRHEFFQIQEGGSNTVDPYVSIGYHFDPNYITDQTKLSVAHWNGTQWEDLGNGAYGGNNNIGAVRTSSVVSTFSPFALASTNVLLNPLEADPFIQIWTGAKSDDWDVADNWNNHIVPGVLSAVTIPDVSTLPHAPKLSSNVYILDLYLLAGSQLDVNNLKMNVNNKMISSGTAIKPVILNNNTVSPDSIRIAIGALGNLDNSIWDGMVVNENLRLDIKGAKDFLEGVNVGNTFNGGFLVFNSGVGAISIGDQKTGVYNSDLKIVDNSTALFKAFTNQASNVGGNFSLEKPNGGEVAMGKIGQSCLISQTINIDVQNSPGNRKAFNLIGFENLVGGGTISAVNVTDNCDIMNNNLKINLLAFNDYLEPSNTKAYTIQNNQIIGNVVIDAISGNLGNQNISSNTFDGVVTIQTDGGNVYEAQSGANIYKGNVFFNNVNPSFTFYLNYFENSLFYKNLTIDGIGAYNFKNAYFVGNSNSIFEDMRASTSNIDSLVIQKTGGATLSFDQPTSVNIGLIFAGGDIISTATNYLTFEDGSAYTGASDNSKVIGPLTSKFTTPTTTSFTFPIGKVGKLIPATLSDFSVNELQSWTAELVDGDATINGYDRTLMQAPLNYINDKNYFLISKSTSTSSNAFVTLGYSVNVGDFHDLPDLRVAHWDGSQWENLGNGATNGTLTEGSVKTSALVTSFSPFAVGSVPNVPTAVNLISFDARLNMDKVDIDWKIAQDKNVSYYEVERSKDGTNFATLEKVNAKQSATMLQYQTVDKQPIVGKSFYRLKMIEEDGQISYSSIKPIVYWNNEDAKLMIYPNPTLTDLHIKSAFNLKQYSIVDINGKTIMKGNLNAHQTISVLDLPSGTYLLNLIDDAGNEHHNKFVKQ
ncbi:MAG TPA: T9SS type A sorting domain-containing protein [Edaphocola sp.]|nr:T9SS type A sorting domain-containing protein [Edaphocola sp.]